MIDNSTRAGLFFFVLISGLIFSLSLADIAAAQGNITAAQTNTSRGRGHFRATPWGPTPPAGSVRSLVILRVATRHARRAKSPYQMPAAHA